MIKCAKMMFFRRSKSDENLAKNEEKQ